MTSRLSLAVLVAATLAAGCGGGGASGPDHGKPSTSYPAPHDAMGQIPKHNGLVQTAPVLVPVTYSNDPMTAQIEDFTSKLGGSAWWTAVASEYGIGAATMGTPVHLAATAPTSLTDAQIEADLASQINGGNPAYPAPTSNTIYLLFYPNNTTITGFGTSCIDYGAYHTAASTSFGYAAYAVIPRCNYFGELETTTFDTSHEAIEAATDPVGGGYWGADAGNGIWDLVSQGGEVGDYCEYQPDAYSYVDSYVVQNSWSNAAAAAGHNPCVPDGGVFFGAAPVLEETSSVRNYQGANEQTKAVRVAMGEKKTIELDLFSDGDTAGPFTVGAKDLASYYGYPVELTFQFDRTSGVNGEKVYVTISRVRAAGVFQGGSAFFIISKKGQKQNFWPVWVSQ